jgi:hypothetical protein
MDTALVTLDEVLIGDPGNVEFALIVLSVVLMGSRISRTTSAQGRAIREAVSLQSPTGEKVPPLVLFPHNPRPEVPF